MARDRPLVVAWTDSASALSDRLAREGDHRRRRLQALLMLRAGQRIGAVSAAVGADYRTIQRWVSWYRTGGLEAVLQRTVGHGGVGAPSKLTPAQTCALLDAYEAGRFRSIRDAVDWTAEHYGVEYTYTGMHAHLDRARRRRHASEGQGRPAGEDAADA